MVYHNKNDLLNKEIRFVDCDFKARITGFIGDISFILHVTHVSGNLVKYYKVGDNIVWPITNKGAFIICDNKEEKEC